MDASPTGIGILVDERELISRVLAGDPAAERELYDAHVDRVYRLAYRMTGSEEEASEYTQDAFVKAFEKLGTFRAEASVGTWLHSITVSVVLNGLRKSKLKRKRETDLDTALDVSVGPTPVEPWIRRRLRAAMDSLSDRYRMVFVMHDVEGYTHQEIGTAMGVAVGTSKSMLFRARAHLREQLADVAKEYAQ